MWRSAWPCYVNAALFVALREIYRAIRYTGSKNLRAKTSGKCAQPGVEKSRLRMRRGMGLEVGPAKPANACLRLPETPETPTGAAQFAGRAPTKARPRTRPQARPQVRSQVRPLWALLWRTVRPCYVNAALFVNVREVVLFATRDRHPRCHHVAKLPRKYALQGMKNSRLRMRLRMGLRIGPAKPANA